MMTEPVETRGVLPPYGVAIHQSIRSGDLDRMKQIKTEAERWLVEHGDVAGALEVLKAEIAKKEGGGRR